MFSVLMSVYVKTDKGQFIECLDSIFEQSLLPNEIIIVKDGRLNFNIFKLLLKYNTIDIIVVENETNLGLSKSLNKGLLECSNDLVFRMDTDDICMKGRFKIQIDKFISNKKLAVLGTNVELIDNMSTQIENQRNVPTTNSEIRKIMPFKNPFNHPSVVFRKSLVQSVGGYSDLNLYEDWFLWFKLSQLKDVEFENLSQKLLKYRIRTFSDRKGLKIIKSEYDFYLRLLKDGFINRRLFVLNVSMKLVVRLSPNFLYRIFKHKFDEIS